MLFGCVVLSSVACVCFGAWPQARNGDRGMATRLTWTRRLLMALDAARGMLYLHSHKPRPILHRNLESLT